MRLPVTLFVLCSNEDLRVAKSANVQPRGYVVQGGTSVQAYVGLYTGYGQSARYS